MIVLLFLFHTTISLIIFNLYNYLSPIACSPSRVYMSSSAKTDLKRYENALQQMYSATSSASLRFERSLRTKGKDHMHVQIIPVHSSRLSETVKIFLQVSRSYDLKFSEIGESDGNIEDVVITMEGGPYQEYF